VAGTSLSAREFDNVRSALDEAAIIAITDKRGIITYVNKKFCAISKYPADELIGKTHKIINSGYHSKEFFSEMWETISSGKVWEGEIQNRAKDGSFYWVYTTIVPYLDTTGKPESYVAVRYEITDRVLAQDQLQVQKNNFQTLFNSTFEGILVHREGNILDANAAALEIFKCSNGQMVNAPLGKFIRSDFHDEFYKRLSGGQDFTMEAIGLSSDGDEIFVGLFGRNVTLGGQQSSLIAVRNLTLRKQMEAQILQQDRLASLGLLASSLAHEIGTPLGVIRGRAEQVQKAADPKTKSTMELIVSQIDRISKLVNSLLHIARGQQSEAASNVNLGAVLDDVINLLNHELKRKDIALEVSAPDALLVKAEPGPLGQVFLNLLVNSIHAIEAADKRDGHKISIGVTKSAHEVEIRIADTGCGISEKNLARLFQPFFTTKDIGLGTGLGLATSYKLVDSWGGKISVQSKVGRGTTFTILLKP